MDNFSEERIKAIVEAYNIKREREKARYLIIKDSDEFKSKNRERARGHYLLNKDKKFPERVEMLKKSGIDI